MQDRVTHSPDALSRSFAPPIGAKHFLFHFYHSVLFAAFVVTLACGWFAGSTSAAQTANPDNILLDFSAKWCGPCQQMSGIVSKLEREHLPIRKVDIDEEPNLARQYGVTAIPCFVLVANGREIKRIEGKSDERTLRSLMMLLPKPAVDDQSIAKSSRVGGTLISTSNASAPNTNDRKLFPRMPSLFGKSQETKTASTDAPDTFRGQTPGLESTDEGYAREPLSASIRIKVKEASKVHFGSGTVIDSEPGRAVILTCGHIFRDLGKDAVIEVDLFSGGQTKPQTVIGQIIDYDLKSDLGLLSIATPSRLIPARMRRPTDPLAVDDQVTSVGCGGGNRPTVQEHKVTAINRYNGPDNIECTGVPQQGRSGGGLFIGSELAGVLFGADPKDKRGLYTSMKPVGQFLAKAKLSHLLQPDSSIDSAFASNDDVPDSGVNLGSPSNVDDDFARRDDDEVANLIAEAKNSAGNPSAAPADYLDAEVVCIVRPKKPGTASRVVVIPQASSRFVGDLLHETGGTNRNQPVTASTKAKPARSAKQPAITIAESEAEVAMQKPSVKTAKSANLDQTVETSFEPQRYRRKSAAGR